MIGVSGLTLKRAGGLLGLTGTLTLAGALLTSQVVSAAGNTNFEGILAAGSPTGFTSSPGSYDISSGPVTVNFDVVAKNLTDEGQTVTLNFSADHILTDNGVNVSDGQPGQAGVAFSGPAGTTQVLMPGTQSFTDEWNAGGSRTISLNYTFDTCGYFQLDVWAPWKGSDNGRSRATLASGFVRILGCGDPSSTPTPTSSPSGGGAAGGTPSSTTTPTSGVQGLTTSVPSTGAGSGVLAVGAALIIAGAGALAMAARRRIGSGDNPETF